MHQTLIVTPTVTLIAAFGMNLVKRQNPDATSSKQKKTLLVLNQEFTAADIVYILIPGIILTHITNHWLEPVTVAFHMIMLVTPAVNLNAAFRRGFVQRNNPYATRKTFTTTDIMYILIPDIITTDITEKALRFRFKLETVKMRKFRRLVDGMLLAQRRN